MFSIPPHRPELNPIENMFQLLPKPLGKDAHDRPITSSKFSVRVSKTIMNFSKDIIDATIKSLEKRIAAMVTTRQGERLKYLHILLYLLHTHFPTSLISQCLHILISMFKGLFNFNCFLRPIEFKSTMFDAFVIYLI